MSLISHKTSIFHNLNILPHVYRLSRHAQFVSFYVNYIGKYICQAAHMRSLVRTYLVRIFPRKGLSTWCKTNFFF